MISLHRRKLAIGTVLLAVWVNCAYADITDYKFTGVRVLDAIDSYQSQGYDFLYSNGLVRDSLRFVTNPPPGSPIARFKLALNGIGLTLDTGQELYRIVRIRETERGRTIKGRVVDATTGLPVAGVKVIIDESWATTDSLGQFEFVPRKASLLSMSRAGYESKTLTSDPTVSTLLEISLAPLEVMDEIVVVSSHYTVHNSQTQTHNIDLDLLNSIPRLGEDPIRIASHLPGMASLGVSAKPHIRGGSHDELLVLFNNMELLEPFHLRDFQSVFSSFNPTLVQSIDVYTGGFPARYGDRMSGVMDINPADNHSNTSGELSLSFLNASATGQGTVLDGRGEWVVSARRGNLDIVTKQINSTVGDPSYSDWFAQMRYELDSSSELDVGIFAYNDDILLQDFDTDGEIATSQYDNLYGWAQLHRTWRPGLDSSTVFYYGTISHKREGTVLDLELEGGEAFVIDDRSFDLFSLGQHFRYAVSDGIFAEFGARVTHQQGRYDYHANIERGQLADFIGTQLIIERDIDLKPSGLSGGVYGSVRLEPIEHLTVEAGLRWDFHDYTTQGHQSQASPRLSVKYDFSEYTELRLSAGRFYQPEAIHELQVGDGIDRYQAVQHADHYILGWHQRFGESGFSLRTEYFYKDIGDPKRRFENLFNSLVLLPELASDRIEITPEKARARGIETTLRYQPSDSVVAWLTYSQTQTEDYFDNAWHPRTWDQGSTISAGLSWELKQWTLGATILWNDGWRTTKLPGVVAANEDVVFERNGDRLRDYVSVDLQLSRTWDWPSQSLTLFAELTNLTNRSNHGGIEYDVEEDTDSGALLITDQPETLLPLVPSLGVRWRF